ncbi:hypothetical protein BS47DRAFT_1353066, partial [Hydnum rufescens UP504]
MDDPNAFIEADVIEDSREHTTQILYRNEKVHEGGGVARVSKTDALCRPTPNTGRYRSI